MIPATPAPPATVQRRAVPLSAIVLIGANAVPLLGVTFLGWTVFSILLLYWSENVVIGAFNILRMAVAEPRDVVSDASKLLLIPFFTVHYGMFTFVHGIFVLTLFGPPGTGGHGTSPASLLAAVRTAGIGYGVLAIALSHGFSFVHNFLMSGEYRRTPPAVLMVQPYARVVVLHITILAGGFLAQAAGAPVAALAVLIVLKTAIDLRAHLAERRKLAVAPVPITPFA
jgi:Family of unknown function (DUF6498)